jgi:hypothetical protein
LGGTGREAHFRFHAPFIQIFAEKVNAPTAPTAPTATIFFFGTRIGVLQGAVKPQGYQESGNSRIHGTGLGHDQEH